jgi:hypothetical protein
MEWYVWVLVVIGIIAIGAIKLTIFSKWMEARKQRESRILEDE